MYGPWQRIEPLRRVACAGRHCHAPLPSAGSSSGSTAATAAMAWRTHHASAKGWAIALQSILDDMGSSQVDIRPGVLEAFHAKHKLDTLEETKQLPQFGRSPAQWAKGNPASARARMSDGERGA